MNSMGWRVNAVKDAVFAAPPSANCGAVWGMGEVQAVEFRRY
jgi:hypothetical protein